MDLSHGGDIYTDGLLKNRKLIDFSSNINPLGLSKNLSSNIDLLFESAARYPDTKYRILKQNIADYLNFYEGTNLNEANILLGNGAIEVIDLIIKYVNSITIIVPSFIEYEFVAKKYNKSIEFINLNSDMKYDYDLIEASVHNTDSLIIANPNNPTGNLIDLEKFYKIVSYCEEANKKIIVDEAFVEFAQNGSSILKLVSKYNCIYIVRAFTKFFGAPGARLGYLINKNSQALNKLSYDQLTWNINCFAEYLAINSFKDSDYIKATKLFIQTEIEYMVSNLRKINIFETVYNTNCNFVLCKLKNMNSTEVYNRLLENNILIRMCDNFRGLDNRYIRLAIKSRYLNDILLNNLKLF